MSFNGKVVSEINAYFPADRPIHVAAYYWMDKQSTEHSSEFEMQDKYYQELIGEQDNWIYSGMYIDKGKKNRAHFNAMIWEAKNGKLDLIVTKNISRLSRNVMDCIFTVRDLLRLKKPVGIYFEVEGLCTLYPQTEMMLNFLSTMAIAESENKGNHTGCIPKNLR